MVDFLCVLPYNSLAQQVEDLSNVLVSKQSSKLQPHHDENVGGYNLLNFNQHGKK